MFTISCFNYPSGTLDLGIAVPRDDSSDFTPSLLYAVQYQHVHFDDIRTYLSHATLFNLSFAHRHALLDYQLEAQNTLPPRCP